MLRGESNLYEDHFECLACNEGCEECADGSACVYDVYTKLRYSFLVINCLFVVISLALAALVFKLWQNKVKKGQDQNSLGSQCSSLKYWFPLTLFFFCIASYVMHPFLPCFRGEHIFK